MCNDQRLWVGMNQTSQTAARQQGKFQWPGKSDTSAGQNENSRRGVSTGVVKGRTTYPPKNPHGPPSIPSQTVAEGGWVMGGMWGVNVPKSIEARPPNFHRRDDDPHQNLGWWWGGRDQSGLSSRPRNLLPTSTRGKAVKKNILEPQVSGTLCRKSIYARALVNREEKKISRQRRHGFHLFLLSHRKKRGTLHSVLQGSRAPLFMNTSSLISPDVAKDFYSSHQNHSCSTALLRLFCAGDHQLTCFLESLVRGEPHVFLSRKCSDIPFESGWKSA